MPDTHTVPVVLDVTPEVAAALADPGTRERVARLVADAVRPASGNAAQGNQGDTGADDLVARFRAFRADKTLGGLSPKELIAEGRR